MAGAVFLASMIAACSEEPDVGFAIERIAYAELTDRLASGPMRLEIELMAEWGESLARELEDRGSHRMGDDERIESSVVRPGFGALTVDRGCRGTLLTALAGVEVRFDERTRFADQDGSRIACIDFVTQIEAFVALGQEPQITAERRPAAAPQNPFDPVFFADELSIDDEDDDGDQRPEIEVNVSAQNLASCGEAALVPSDCVGALRVLGRVIAVGGSTEVEIADPAPRLEVRFRGIVDAVDVARRQVRLNTGAVVRLVRGSEIEWGTGDWIMGSLEDADHQMRSGRMVEAHGRAAVMSTDPLVLWVTEIELELERDQSRSAYRDVVTIHGEVLGADVTNGFVDMPFDTRLRITEVSNLEGDFHGLSEIGRAMVTGQRVYANARVVVEEVQRPTLVTRADRVTFLIDGP